MTAPKLLPPADPYDHTDERNHLAVHTPQPRALAMKDAIGKLLLDNQSEFVAIARAAGVPAESMVLELLSVVRKKPEIRQCTPDSIMTFMFDAAKLGLQIGTELDPVPVNHGQGRDREKRLEAWPNYKGHRTLALSTGAVRDIYAQVVFEGDTFEFSLTPIPHVERHVPGPHFGDMKYATHVYATAVYPGGRVRSVLLSKAKVEELRKKNRGDTDKSTSPWVSHPEAMWMAKAIKVFAKQLPQNPRLAHLFRVEARLEEAEQIAAPAPMAQLPAGEPVTEGQFEPVEETPAAPTMSLGEASAIGITTKGGHARMLGEMRNSGVEAVLTWARAGLEQDPDAQRLQRIAIGCTTVLEARAAGLAKEPPKQEGN